MDRPDNSRFIVEMRQLIFLVLPALLLLQTATASSLYKWVDENGNIVYSQSMPPPGAKVLQQPRIRGLHTPPPPAESDNAPQQVESATSTVSASSEAEPARNLTEDQQEQYREYCQNLRKNLELLTQPKRVYVGTEDGGRHYLSDEEREEKIRSTNEKISKHCQEK